MIARAPFANLSASFPPFATGARQKNPSAIV